MQRDRQQSASLPDTLLDDVNSYRSAREINARPDKMEETFKTVASAGFFAIWLILSLVFLPCEAAGFIGQGRSVNHSEAERMALADLALVVRSAVQSIGNMLRKEDTELPAVRRVLVTNAALPVIGATVKVTASGHDYLATAALTPNTAEHLYNEKLQSIRKSVGHASNLLVECEVMPKTETILKELLTQIDRFYRHKLVAMLLTSRRIENLKVSETTIKARLQDLNRPIDRLDQALDKITKSMSTLRPVSTFIYSPLTQYALEVTPFARQISDWLSIRLGAVEEPALAKRIMEGEYEFTTRGLMLTYRLQDVRFDTLKTEVVVLGPKAYHKRRAVPTSVEFGKQLHRGRLSRGFNKIDLRPTSVDESRIPSKASSQESLPNSVPFRVDLRTNRGNRAVSYRTGETGQLHLKMTQPGFFYIVGHVAKPEKNYSYLMQLRDTGGAHRFVSFLGEDKINKWIDLGHFEVVPPLGMEALQVFASTTDPVAVLPSSRFDPKSKLYVAEGKPKQVMHTSRALVLSAIKRGVAEEKHAEAVLNFHTFPAN